MVRLFKSITMIECQLVRIESKIRERYCVESQLRLIVMDGDQELIVGIESQERSSWDAFE